MATGVGPAGSTPDQTSLSPRNSTDSLRWAFTVTSRSASEMICGGRGNTTSHSLFVPGPDARNRAVMRAV